MFHASWLWRWWWCGCNFQHFVPFNYLQDWWKKVSKKGHLQTSILYKCVQISLNFWKGFLKIRCQCSFFFRVQLSVWFVLSNKVYFNVRIVINPEKRPYNMSEVILWTLDSGNTANTLEMNNDNEECYYFERLEKVLATQVVSIC